MDTIFKALNDPARRAVLDLLRERDGRTSTQIEEALLASGFEMTRFGVMKHLKVLEVADLVTVRRSGRFKHHYLNAVPIQQVMDRWMEPLVAKPLARAVLDLKASIEEDKT
ncbi:helix-turn-helix domain-containing protein [Ahrensia sp. R2A130]|uniref:helix-turn-helix domain-containing protein n=1 Tax=Ahrensia sp. R2A130 TaxID=744979 RepID=UPI0001E0BC3F|nr:helix-turn-helix domain-containing protein [Ahrensia sp. R2A130]EFL90753.1 toxin-antitoxin system, antitoxin component, ArsR family [Ahrensia sp. R2A130]